MTHIPVSINVGISHFDKVVHASTYALLAFMLMRAVNLSWGRGVRVSLGVLGVLASYGAIDELLQIPIPGRQGDIKDWIADMVGAITGVITYQLFVRYAVPWIKTVKNSRRSTPPSKLPDKDRCATNVHANSLGANTGTPVQAG